MARSRSDTRVLSQLTLLSFNTTNESLQNVVDDISPRGIGLYEGLPPLLLRLGSSGLVSDGSLRPSGRVRLPGPLFIPLTTRSGVCGVGCHYEVTKGS